jgi:hypothetical protein
VTRSHHEPLELEDIFERDEAARRRKMADDVVEANKKRIEREDKAAAERKEAARRFAMKVNADQLCAEYRTAGVEPPRTDFDGVPTTSLSMLLLLGWRIECVSGQNRLVEPPPLPKRKRRDENDEQGS